MQEELKNWVEQAMKVIRIYWDDPEADMCPTCGVKPEGIAKLVEGAYELGWKERGEDEINSLK